MDDDEARAAEKLRRREQNARLERNNHLAHLLRGSRTSLACARTYLPLEHYLYRCFGQKLCFAVNQAIEGWLRLRDIEPDRGHGWYGPSAQFNAIAPPDLVQAKCRAEGVAFVETQYDQECDRRPPEIRLARRDAALTLVEAFVLEAITPPHEPLATLLARIKAEGEAVAREYEAERAARKARGLKR